MKNNNKITLQKLYDEIIPLLTDIAMQKVEIASIKKDIEEIKIDLRCKMSIKAFVAWLSALATIIAIIATILSFVFIRS